MPDFDVAGLALQMVCPTNKLIADKRGLPGAYVQVASKKLSELLKDGDSTVHPAFMVGGVERTSLFIGKYQGVLNGNCIYSLPGVTPTGSITLDNYEAYCRSKGRGHHCMTAAEWAFLALWCRKNNHMPNGNNYYGRDVSETEYLAIPASNNLVTTGTGPLSWRHNGQFDGICDLNGNIWEWVSGIRIVYGELQVIPYNNAADPDVDIGAASAQWKAINAAASSWNDLFIDPDGSGTTSGSVKLDWVTDHWQWASSITSRSSGSRFAIFGTTTSAGLSAAAKLYLQAMALLPEDGADTYYGDCLYCINGAAERYALRGGSCSYGSKSGMFTLGMDNLRSILNAAVGGRPAYVQL